MNVGELAFGLRRLEVGGEAVCSSAEWKQQQSVAHPAQGQALQSGGACAWPSGPGWQLAWGHQGESSSLPPPDCVIGDL